MKHVLIVDDDPSIRLLLGRVLEQWGYGVQTAPDGQEALAFIRNGTLDLVITDVEMEQLDGVSLLKISRAVRPSLPVIVMTAGHRFKQAEMLQTGASAFTHKPISISWLQSTLKRLQL